MEFLPFYMPSEQERANPDLFASNVQDVVAAAAGVPASTLNINDCQLLWDVWRLAPQSMYRIRLVLLLRLDAHACGI